jgi:flagellar biosynthetic protein FliP
VTVAAPAGAQQKIDPIKDPSPIAGIEGNGDAKKAAKPGYNPNLKPSDVMSLLPGAQAAAGQDKTQGDGAAQHGDLEALKSIAGKKSNEKYALEKGDDSPEVSISVKGDPNGTSTPLQIITLLTILSIAPGILMTMTSFTRIVIVLGLTRNALGAQQLPPNQVLMGLALCLTFFTMQPTLAKIDEHAIQPYRQHKITFDQAVERATPPVRNFMLRQTREADLKLFVEMSRMRAPRTAKDVPMHVLLPAFIISEMKTAFTMGFVIFLPFLVVDLVVSLVLMSMGMVMLPPALVSLPFKLLLFVLVDGWHLLAQALALSFA